MTGMERIEIDENKGTGSNMEKLDKHSATRAFLF